MPLIQTVASPLACRLYFGILIVFPFDLFFGNFRYVLRVVAHRPEVVSRAAARVYESGDEGDRTLNPRLAKPVQNWHR